MMMNIQINKEALPGSRAGKKFEKWSYFTWRDKSAWKIATRFSTSTDGEGDEKEVDIKISSSENVEIFLAQYL